MTEKRFITIDIGSAWTKVFLVKVDTKSRVNIEKTLRLPTSVGDPIISVKTLLSKVSKSEGEKILVSHLEEMEKLAKEIDFEFVSEDQASQSLVDYFSSSGSQTFILDAGASNLHQSFKASSVGRYLSFAINEISLENIFGSRFYYPQILPDTSRKLEIDESTIRVVFEEKVSNLNTDEKKLLVLTGGVFSGNPNSERLAMIVLDIMRFGQTHQVLLDKSFFLPSFGAILTKDKKISKAIPGAWFQSLGAFLALQSGIRVDLDWGFSQLQTVELESNEISIIPAQADQNVQLSYTVNKEKKKFEIFGGSLGIVFDSRSRPLQLAFGQEQSRKNVLAWLAQLKSTEII